MLFCGECSKWFNAGRFCYIVFAKPRTDTVKPGGAHVGHYCVCDSCITFVVETGEMECPNCFNRNKVKDGTFASLRCEGCASSVPV